MKKTIMKWLPYVVVVVVGMIVWREVAGLYASAREQVIKTVKGTEA